MAAVGAVTLRPAYTRPELYHKSSRVLHARSSFASTRQISILYADKVLPGLQHHIYGLETLPPGP
jgi:hypothetical protein